jgi:hypothetical protein
MNDIDTPDYTASADTKVQNALHMKQQQQGRTGLCMVRIGSQHMVKLADGSKIYVEVLDRSRHRKAKCCARCLTCGVEFPTSDELIEAHPEEDIMARNNEQHIWGFYSSDLKDPKNPKSGSIGLLSSEPL